MSVLDVLLEMGIAIDVIGKASAHTGSQLVIALDRGKVSLFRDYRALEDWRPIITVGSDGYEPTAYDWSHIASALTDGVPVA